MSPGATAAAAARRGAVPIALRCVALLCLPCAAAAQESLADLPSFREGCQALADERFETAESRLRECWSVVREGDAAAPEAHFVAARLLEAMVRDGAASEAVAWVVENPEFRADAATSYWIGAAFQAEGRFAEAAEHYQVHLAAAVAPDRSSVINHAVCLARSGQAAAAHDRVRDLKPSGPEEVLRLALIAAAASREDEALALLEAPMAGDPARDSLRLSFARLRASLLARRGDFPAARAALYEAVGASSDPDSARRALLLLEVFLDGERPAELTARLDAWIADASFAGREAARLYRQILLGAEPERTRSLQEFAAATADPALRAEALLRVAAPGEAAARDEERLPDDLRQRLAFAPAAAAYREGRFEEALRLFSVPAPGGGEDAGERDLFNAALSALRLGDAGAYGSLEEALARSNPRSLLLVDLSYIGGLFFAAKGDPAGIERLSRFVGEHPEHPANIDARLALAEIHLNQAPARPREAREAFEFLRTRPLTLSQSERLDYAAVWAERIDGDGAALLRRAEEFVSNWPGSGRLAEVLMILASEQYSRKQSAAASSFHRVAAQFPGSPFAGAARFFEAKASPAAEETVAKWRAISGEKGGFADEAAHELGLLLLSLDRFEEAEREFEGLLARLPPEAPLRFAAMADLAYASYLEALASEKDPAKLGVAAERFAALSGLEAAPAFWRFNAAVRRGKCLEALGKPAIALEIYRSIVDETRDGGGAAPDSSPEETAWVFRAGFAAIGILVAGRDWTGAIEVADALSGKSGPRAIEAARLAERLRLKHWVWD
jgi:outer membrane protein assembly factor BamD (BamD/ComL family)